MPFLFFDVKYMLAILPAILIAMWAQWRVRSAYSLASQQSSPLSAAAARHILDSAGMTTISIEEIPGELSDHYDPRDKVLRLSQNVYHGKSLAAVGIAAHEAGHAMQDAQGYAAMIVRNAAIGRGQLRQFRRAAGLHGRSWARTSGNCVAGHCFVWSDSVLSVSESSGGI